ncbi:MAG: type II toxin-antitoxin system VapC family toxin [Chloroflexi bacterium]|nr:type II toxin-antitoxin system VapC family toxin [Chloroflexota bacterium]
MNAVDSSVIIAAFSTWHGGHAAAAAALREKPHFPAHAAVEAYSVLTRLPNPFRSSPMIVHASLVENFGERSLEPRTSMLELIGELANLEIFGGAAYDGLIGVTARDHDATLLTLDRRALATYDRLGVRTRVVT